MTYNKRQKMQNKSFGNEFLGHIIQTVYLRSNKNALSYKFPALLVMITT